MKIALVSAANSIHTVRWANALSRKGHGVTVFACKNHTADKNNLYDSAVEISLLPFPSPLGYYLNAIALKSRIRKGKFDVVNVHYASGYGTLGRLSKLKNALLNIWGSDVYEFPYQSAGNMKTITKNLSYYRFLASTSNCMAKQAKKLADREFFITPFGVDTTQFCPIENVKAPETVIFGTVKTLSPKYGIADTINAFILLVRRLEAEGQTDLAEKLRYEIYGSGEMKEELQKLIDDNGMTEKITLCGYVPNDQLPNIYNRFTVANSNSISDSESFGVAAVEAMACGVPVQVSDADGFAEVVADGETGLIAPKGNVEAIAENMYTLLTDSDLRDRLGKNGVERVRKLYDWDKNVDTMINIYNRITESK